MSCDEDRTYRGTSSRLNASRVIKVAAASGVDIERNRRRRVLAAIGGKHGDQTWWTIVGIVVGDLEEAIAFFTELGLELEGRGMVEGEWAGRVTGLGDQSVEIAMMRTPDGHSRLELSRFLRPAVIEDHRDAPVNALGYLRVMFAVDDLEETLMRLGSSARLEGELVDYQGVYRLCYIRGPGGLLIGLGAGTALNQGPTMATLSRPPLVAGALRRSRRRPCRPGFAQRRRQSQHRRQLPDHARTRTHRHRGPAARPLEQRGRLGAARWPAAVCRRSHSAQSMG